MEMAQPTTTPPAHGGDGHAPVTPSSASASMDTTMSSLFWGDRAVVLFPGWPGERGLGAYLLSLLFVLALAAVAEALHAVSAYVAHRRRRRRRGAADVVSALLLTAVHAARMGAAYLLMLAVMSFNGGVLLAAVAGHALGFLLTRSWAKAEEVEHEHGDGAGGAGRGRDRVPPLDDAGKA